MKTYTPTTRGRGAIITSPSIHRQYLVFTHIKTSLRNVYDIKRYTIFQRPYDKDGYQCLERADRGIEDPSGAPRTQISVPRASWQRNWRLLWRPWSTSSTNHTYIIRGRPPRSHPNFLQPIGNANNASFLYQHASISASGARISVDHHERLFCSFSAKTTIQHARRPMTKSSPRHNNTSSSFPAKRSHPSTEY